MYFSELGSDSVPVAWSAYPPYVMHGSTASGPDAGQPNARHTPMPSGSHVILTTGSHIMLTRCA